MNWIRVSVAIADDPRVHEMAAQLDVRVAEAVGLLICLLRKFPEHAPTGNVAAVRPALLELWAMWGGRRGRFDATFRALFLNGDGAWVAWEKHNGAALREAEAARVRAQAYREAKRSGNGSPNGTGNGSPNGTPNRSALRTDGRTKLPGARARGHGELQPIRPHLAAVAIAPPWCPECGDGELEPVPGQRRPVRVHAPHCSRHVPSASNQQVVGVGTA